MVLEVDRDTEIEIGALGGIHFEEGYYCYVGSAFGPGGIKRVLNHIKILEGEKDRNRWHIDYLNSNQNVSAHKIFLTSEKVECDISQNIDAEPVLDFGSSDCKCSSHLKYGDGEDLLTEIESGFENSVDSYSTYSVEGFKHRFSS